MLQIQIVTGENVKDLTDKTNACLAPISTEAVRDIDINVKELTAVIQYQLIEEWTKRLCSECQYWDDSGSSSAVSGLCQDNGRRYRFNCQACKNFKDVRG